MQSLKSCGGLTRGGITEGVRLQWIYSMHKCAGVHAAMTTMTNLKKKASEQHVELDTSRSKRDFQHLIKIRECFNQHEPFDLKKVLCLAATDGDHINPDKERRLGTKSRCSLMVLVLWKHQLKEVTKLSFWPIFSQEYK